MELLFFALIVHADSNAAAIHMSNFPIAIPYLVVVSTAIWRASINESASGDSGRNGKNRRDGDHGDSAQFLALPRNHAVLLVPSMLMASWILSRWRGQIN